MKQLLAKMVMVSALYCNAGAFAQAPNWNVNPTSYQYSMTVSAVASKNCTLLSDTGNIIAAFEGTTCRGVARTGSEVNGRKVASLVVYSNSTSGETIRFKAYNKNNNEILDLKNTLLFEEGITHGYSGSPYELYTNRPPLSLDISNKQMPETIKKGDVVGLLFAVDPDTADTKTFSLVNGEGSTHNNLFVVEGSNLKLNADLPENTTLFNVRIRVSDQHGCSSDSAFVFTKGQQTGMSEMINTRSFVVYPNPAHSILSIEYDVKNATEVSVALYDLTGKEIAQIWKGKSDAGKQTHRIDINKLSADIYILKIKAGGQVFNKKISVF